MALYRQLQLSFWTDGFVMDLTPEEKFFYVYLLQCSNTKQCGIFELPKRAIEYETGYNKETIDKLLERLINYGKIEYCEKTKEIMIINWIKYNFINSRNTIMCINKELKEVKNKEFVAKLYLLCKGLEYPLEDIFKDVDGFQEKIRGLQGACKPLGEEEIKEEIKEEVEEVKEVKEVQVKIKFADADEEFFEKDEVVVGLFNNSIHLITSIGVEKLRGRRKDINWDTAVLEVRERAADDYKIIRHINSS